MEKSDRIYIPPKPTRRAPRKYDDLLPLKFRLRTISIGLLVSAGIWFGAWQIMKALHR